jgi:hypothetical protein
VQSKKKLKAVTKSISTIVQVADQWTYKVTVTSAAVMTTGEYGSILVLIVVICVHRNSEMPYKGISGGTETDKQHFRFI